MNSVEMEVSNEETLKLSNEQPVEVAKKEINAQFNEEAMEQSNEASTEKSSFDENSSDKVANKKLIELLKDESKQEPNNFINQLPNKVAKLEIDDAPSKQTDEEVNQLSQDDSETEQIYEVPMRHYAGKLLPITDLVMPNNSEERRPSYFDRKGIEQMLLKYSVMENVSRQGPFKEELVDGILSAVETYAKYMVKSVIELCEHRTAYWLYNDPRCVMQHDMRSTMMFLNDREAADFGGTDDEAPGHRSRWMKLKRKHPGNSSLEHEMRLESTNTTALLALGGRKPTASTLKIGPGGAGPTLPLPPRAPSMRAKRVIVKDIIQFLENNRRFARSQLLYEAYLTYNL